MSYKKAKDILPAELVKLIQKYVDGEHIYIPRREENKKCRGSNTAIRRELDVRNSNIYNDYLSGMDMTILGGKYYLSSESIQRIVLNEKRKRTNFWNKPMCFYNTLAYFLLVNKIEVFLSNISQL